MSKKSEKGIEIVSADDDGGQETQRQIPSAEQQIAPAEDLLDERMRLAIEAAADKKAIDVIALDLRAVANFTDCFIIASGANTRQVQAIADAVEEALKRHGTRPARIEGYKAAEWVLIDYGDFIVHVFESKARQFYDLERLWRDARRVTVPEPGENPAAKSGSSSAVATTTAAAAGPDEV